MVSKYDYFHFTSRVIQRSKGDNFFQKVSYRTGGKMHDLDTGRSFNYENKQRIEKIESHLFLPKTANEKMHDRDYFYEQMYKSEKRRDAQFFREFEFSLYNDLTKEQNKELAFRFAEKMNEYGMCVDLNFHKLDTHNPHCHAIVSMRSIDKKTGEFGKKERKWNDKTFYKENVRKFYADLSNDYFKELGIEKNVSEKSYKELGINRTPQKHLPLLSKSSKEEIETVKNFNREVKIENSIKENEERREDYLKKKQNERNKRMLNRESYVELQVKKDSLESMFDRTKILVNTSFSIYDEVQQKNKKSDIHNKETKQYENVFEKMLDQFSKEEFDNHQTTLSLYTRRKSGYKTLSREEVREMINDKTEVTGNGISNGFANVENNVKNSTKKVVKTAGKFVYNGSKLTIKTMGEQFKERANTRKQREKELKSALTDMRNKNNEKESLFKETVSTYSSIKTKARTRINDLKQENSEIKAAIRSTKLLSITGMRERKEMRNKLRENKQSIKRQKTMVRNRTIELKEEKKELKLARKEERKINRERVKNELLRRKEELLSRKHKEIETPENSKVVSLQELRDKRLQRQKENENDKSKEAKVQGTVVNKPKVNTTDKKKDNVIKITVNQEAIDKMKENKLEAKKEIKQESVNLVEMLKDKSKDQVQSTVKTKDNNKDKGNDISM